MDVSGQPECTGVLNVVTSLVIYWRRTGTKDKTLTEGAKTIAEDKMKLYY